MTYAEMPPEAEDVMRTVKRWMKTDPSGPTLRQLRCVCRNVTSAERGLRFLKRNRLVTWTNDGAATRYAARTRR